MISPEVLRRYPFFGPFNDAQLKTIAMLSDEISISQGTVLFHQGQEADKFYFLIDGNLDLYHVVSEENRNAPAREFSVGEVNPGEPAGISSMIEPYRLTSTARTASACHLIEMDAKALRGAVEQDPAFGLLIMKAVAKATLERLNITRTQLAAAWA